MAAPRKYPLELLERGVRMVFEVREETGESRGAVTRVAKQLGVCTPKHCATMCGRARSTAVTGPGATSSDAARLAELERENRELRRANAIPAFRVGFLCGGARPPTPQMIDYIDVHEAAFGVEPICTVLAEAGVAVAPSTYYAAKTRPPSAGIVRDEALKVEIMRVFDANYRVYGADKVGAVLNRDGVQVARCTVEQLMRELGIRGAVRGTTRRSTITDPAAERPADLVERQFRAPGTEPAVGGRPDLPADLVRVGLRGVRHRRLLPDDRGLAAGHPPAHRPRPRRPVRWRSGAASSRPTTPPGTCRGWCTTPTAGWEYLAIRYTERLADAGAVSSVGSRGDSYDNALATSFNGLYKTELIRPHAPWRSQDDLELSTMEYIDWYNHRRLHGEIGMIPPAELETTYYARISSAKTVDVT